MTMLSRVYLTRRLNGRAIQSHLGGQQAMMDATGFSQTAASLYFGDVKNPKPIGTKLSDQLDNLFKDVIVELTGSYYPGWFGEPHIDLWNNQLTKDDLSSYADCEPEYPESAIITSYKILLDVIDKHKSYKFNKQQKIKLLAAFLHHWKNHNEQPSEKDVEIFINLIQSK